MFELYVVTDAALSCGRPDHEVARLAYEGGADAVQLRMKGAPAGEMLRQAKIIKEAADRLSKFFIVNDRVDVAAAVDADGVHLGLSDMPVEDARKILGDDKIVGATVHNLREAFAAAEAGADYLSVGSIFSTKTKADAVQMVGLDAIFEIKEALDIPLIAIGGIDRGNIQDVIRAGADGVAVVSAVVSKPDISAAAHELRDMILKIRPNI